MARPGIPDSQKIAEGKALEAAYKEQKRLESGLSQEALINEMGLSSQGLFYQWISGRTAIPDKRLLWLGKRLGFDAAKLRPSIASDYSTKSSQRAKPIAPFTSSTTKAPLVNFKQLVKLVEGKLPLGTLAKDYEHNVECGNNSFVVTVWNNANAILIQEGSDVLIDMDAPVEVGDFGLYYLDSGSAIIAKNMGYSLELVNSAVAPPPPEGYTAKGKVLAIMQKLL